MPKNKEIRSNGEIRAVTDDGIFEGYLTVWGVTDSYNSQFQRGAFAKTIRESGGRVKIMFDHEHLIGSVVELREDAHGLFGCGKLNLDVEKAAETYSFMKSGALDGLSFGFRTIKEDFEGGIRMIKEVQLYEFGPVVFPAGDESKITAVRSEDFNASLQQEDLYRKKRSLEGALEITLQDIWWSDESTAKNIIGKIDTALSDHHAAYLEFANQWVTHFWINRRAAHTGGNELMIAFAEMLEGRSVDIVATETSLTKSELIKLQRGQLIDSREKLTELPENIRTAHQAQRCKAVEALCSELRAGLSNAEKRRVAALLQPAPEQLDNAQSDISTFLSDFRKKLN